MSYLKQYENIEKEYPTILTELTENIVRRKIALNFPTLIDNENTDKQLDKAIEIIEFKLIEQWNKQDKTFIENCSNYLDIALLLPLPEDDWDRIVFVLKLISFGYLGEDWHKVRKYLIDNEHDLTISSNSIIWNKHLLQNIYLSIFFLVRKKTWTDLSQTIKIINELRFKQKDLEGKYINSISHKTEQKISALELAALYHFAKIAELIAQYQMEGNPNDIKEQLNYHFENAQKYCEITNDIEFILLLKYLQPAFHKMISNSIWNVAKSINSRVTLFVKSLIKTQNSVLELLYPQRETILEKGLLDPANKAVVVSLPTSSGKTLIAEFRILQALNQFAHEEGWVVYTVPTKALVNQITLRLKKDLSNAPLSLHIEKLSGALEIDAFEENILSSSNKFNILVTTYEKLGLLIRQGIEEKLKRPLSLVVVDEAHNLEERERGLGLELMLSGIKKVCNNANFLLLTPEINPIDSLDIAKWLSDSSTSIHISIDWQPNDRIIGEIYKTGEARTRNAEIFFKSYLTTKKTLDFKTPISLKKYEENCPFSQSQLNTKYNIAAIAATNFIAEEAILIIADDPKETLKVAQVLFNLLPDFIIKPENKQDIELLKKFVAIELGDDYPLIHLLDKGIAVHSSALPDDIKQFIELLVEKNIIRYLVATTTIAQGINFPVSAIFMSSYSYPYKVMPSKDFWNLVGRAGRIGQKNIGLVGVAVKDDSDRKKLVQYLKNSTNDLVSALKQIVDDTIKVGEKFDLTTYFYRPEWSKFLQYISHMYNQAKDLEEFLKEIDLTLRRTYGYNKLNEFQKRALTDSVKEYAKSINKGLAKLSDSTGFSTVSLYYTQKDIRKLQLSKNDWNSSNLFNSKSNTLQKLVGVMLNTPEIKQSIEQAKIFSTTNKENTFANVITDWVNGTDIKTIADKYFNKDLTECTKAIYSKLIHSASWGLSAFQHVSFDWEKLTETEKKQLKNLPSMIYYGVDTESAILMRKENVPRIVAKELGKQLELEFGSNSKTKSSIEINEWLKQLSIEKWQNSIPKNKKINGDELKKIWSKITDNE